MRKIAKPLLLVVFLIGSNLFSYFRGSELGVAVYSNLNTGLSITYSELLRDSAQDTRKYVIDMLESELDVAALRGEWSPTSLEEKMVSLLGNTALPEDKNVTIQSQLNDNACWLLEHRNKYRSAERYASQEDILKALEAKCY